MKINPYPPASLVAPREADVRTAPSESVARTADLQGHWRRTSEPLITPAQALKYAESLLPKDTESATRDLRDPRASKALAAYNGVANTPERDYVSRLLGFDDFA